MPELKQAERPVRVVTPLGEDVLLFRRMTGTERLGQPFQYELILLSEQHDVDPLKVIGGNMTVYVDKGDHEPRFFNGYVARFAQTRYERQLCEYRATLVPWLWFLSRASNCRIFQNQTIPEILKKVFEDHGFSDIIDRLHGSYRSWEYCVQYGETDLNFVSRLMEQEGIYYYFKHEDGKHTLVLCDSPASHKEFEGYEELHYRPSARGTQETLWTWVVEHAVQPGGYSTADFDFANPRKPASAGTFMDRGHAGSQYEMYEYLGECSPFDEGERYGRLRIEEYQAEHSTYAGDGDARGICNGVRFMLRGHPRKDLEVEYLTTSATSRIESDPFESTEQAGNEFVYEASLTAIPLDQQFRPRRVTSKPTVPGPQTAVVVGAEGEKIDVDEFGRVKVQFHWDRVGSNDRDSSCWLRVSQGWAGKRWGDMAIPHVGDEVIVEFLEGDPDRPIITGHVYNQANMPPLDLPTNKHKRILQDDYGNKLVLDATPGDEHIRLYSPHHNSGITLGRSACNWTNSNHITANVGDNIATVFGMNIGATVGGYISTVLGLNLGAIVGTNCNIYLGPQVVCGYGPVFSYTSGIKYEKNESDFLKVCEKDVVISAGGALNLVGGGRGKPKTSILHANDNIMELTVGDKKEVDELTYQGHVKAMNIAAVVIPVVAAIFMGATGAFVETNPNSEDDKFNKDTHGKQVAMEAIAAALGVVGFIALAMGNSSQKQMAKQTKRVSHRSGEAACRLRLQKTGTALFRATKKISMWSGSKKSAIEMDASAIKLEHKSGDVIIQAGTNSVKVNSSGVEIGGAKVKIGGTDLDFGNGAMTIMGSPAITASTLAASLGEMEADDAQVDAKREAYEAAKWAQVIAMLEA